MLQPTFPKGLIWQPPVPGPPHFNNAPSALTNLNRGGKRERHGPQPPRSG